MVNSTSGNVGIGTTTPDNKLEVVGGNIMLRRSAAANMDRIILGTVDPNIGFELRSGSTGGTPYIDFSNDSTSDFDVRLLLTGNNALRIDGGAVGIGVSNQPGAQLHVVGGDVAITSPGTGIVLRSPNGLCRRVTVDNNGNFVSSPSMACPPS
jgi:hypothetical protein